MWAFEEDVAQNINQNHSNSLYLPNIALADSIATTSNITTAIHDADLVLSICPAQHVHRITTAWLPHARSKTIVTSTSKNIEQNTNLLISDIFDELLEPEMRKHITFISDPSFAHEVAERKPTVVVVATEHETLAEQIQHILALPSFRTYHNTNIIGVEVGNALKNVIALTTGICDGMGLGYNARAALITRGLTEITRMAVALGANPITLMGLSNQGDLILTCTTDLSRNRSVGKALGSGHSLKKVLNSMPQVVEGVTTARSTYQLTRKLKVDTPIIDEVYHVLYEKRPVEGSVKRLMTRALKREKV